MTNTVKLLLMTAAILVRCANTDSTPEPNNIVKKNHKECYDIEAIPFISYSDFSRINRFKLWKKRKRFNSVRYKRSPQTDFELIRFTVLYEQSTEASVSVADHETVIEVFKRQWPVLSWERYGLFTEDYLELINPHWLSFPPPAAELNYALGGLYVALCIVGCCGNALVLFMYCRCRTLRTPGNILVANLALSDFLMLSKTPIFIFNSFNFGPALGKTGCVIYGFMGGWTGVTSIATLSAIALDRYWAVVRPLEPLRALTAIRARLLAIGAWLYAAVFASIPAMDIGYGRYVPEGYLTSCSFDYLTNEVKPRYFIFVFFCAAWILPLCTITYCYLNILHVVVGNRNVTTANKEHLSSRHIKEQAKRKAEIKLAVLVIAVIVLFFVSWTPYAVVALLGIFGQKHLISPLASMVPALFCKTAACINPFIYIITHPKFKKEFRKLLYREKSKRLGGGGGTMKTLGYTVTSTKTHRPSKDLSESDEVEVVAMEDIPYQDERFARKAATVKSISAKVVHREGSQRSMSMKSFEEDVVSPPSWYAKPKFTKKKSFQNSFKSNP